MYIYEYTYKALSPRSVNATVVSRARATSPRHPEPCTLNPAPVTLIPGPYILLNP